MGNNHEKFSRHKKSWKPADSLKEYEDVKSAASKKFRLDPIVTEKTPVKQTVSKEWKGIASQNGLYTLAQLQDLLKRKKDTFEKLGFTKVEIVPYSEIEGYNKTVYAVEIEGTRKKTKVHGHIAICFEKPANPNEHQTTPAIEYFLKTPDLEQHLETIQVPEGFDFEWIQEYSKGAKVVKSRPMWMYEDLLGVDKKELWPKNADIAVIGDPYQKCDREHMTLVEYEYADEMLPHTLLSSLVEPEKPEKIEQATRNFYEDIYRENIESLDRIYGGYDPHYANPYKAAITIMTKYLGEHVATMGQKNPVLQKNIEEIKKITNELLEGTWTLEEGKALIQKNKGVIRVYNNVNEKDSTNVLTEKEMEDLQKWHEYKQESILALGNPEAWKDYITRWNNYLSILPIERIQETIPDVEKKISQTKHFLEIIPTTKSTQRLHAAMGYLREFANELVEKAYQEKDPEMAVIFDPAIWHIEEGGVMGDGAVSFFRPGTPLSQHNANTLREFMDRLDQLDVYEKKIYPGLALMHRQINQDEIPLDSQMQRNFLKTFEHAAARNMFFRKRAQKATPIHGFFPHNFPGMDPQDRIVALTSVTMHAWNHLGEEGFYKDIYAALPFLKPGGKYILGPVNQHAYFGGYGTDFDCEGLTIALQKMKHEGKIEYSFVKGRRERREAYDTLDDHEEEEFSKDPEVLLQGESAKSLIITKK